LLWSLLIGFRPLSIIRRFVPIYFLPTIPEMNPYSVNYSVNAGLCVPQMSRGVVGRLSRLHPDIESIGKHASATYHEIDYREPRKIADMPPTVTSTARTSMNRRENEPESFGDNFVAASARPEFFEVPYNVSSLREGARIH
jgi:hypothetical protein